MWTRSHLIALALAAAVAGGPIQSQQILRPAHDDVEITRPPAPKLHGRFLHITDLHPDSFYKIGTATDGANVCHHGRGAAGAYGAEVTGCDSPWTLLDATFDWIAANLRDRVDFVVWTGDSARHDNDPAFPRDPAQVLGLNRRAAEKFLALWGTGDRRRPLAVPVVPTIGNNDVLPHNAFFPGPNKWTRSYLDVWREFIPKRQRRAFDRGGWHVNEVVPGRLAVVSLNSLYWYTKNAAVDGCADRHEPGHAHFEWLREELQQLRARGVKAIVMGHVPPARTASKQSWDESCWQKYALWMHRYRDVIVGSVWGHVNTDHFLLQDVRDVTEPGLRGHHDAGRDGFVSVRSTENYLNDLRRVWSRIPTPPKDVELDDGDNDDGLHGGAETSGLLDRIFGRWRRYWWRRRRRRRQAERQKKAKKFYDEIGGPWAERYTLDMISPSMVPNYYPTLRIVEYNVSGLHDPAPVGGPEPILPTEMHDEAEEEEEDVVALDDNVHDLRRRHKKHRRKRDYFRMPEAPSKSAPPGPAHSPQTFSWLSYQQLFLNITTLNRQYDEQRGPPLGAIARNIDEEGPRISGHKEHRPKPSRNVTFEVEYDTRDDREFALKDLTVRSFMQLATRIGKFKPEKGDILCGKTDAVALSSSDEPHSDVKQHAHAKQHAGVKQHAQSSDLPSSEVETERKKHKKKHGKRKIINRTWFAFVQRAYVSTLDENELHDNFGQPDEGESARLCRKPGPFESF